MYNLEEQIHDSEIENRDIPWYMVDVLSDNS